MLTAQEVRIVLFVLGALLFGTLVSHFRTRAKMMPDDREPTVKEVHFKHRKPILFPD
jgi:hypothetical protein